MEENEAEDLVRRVRKVQMPAIPMSVGRVGAAREVREESGMRKREKNGSRRGKEA